MNSIVRQVCVAAAMACGAVGAQALVIDFENLILTPPSAALGDTVGEIDYYFGGANFGAGSPFNYGGFQFGNVNTATTDWFVSNKFATGGSLNPYNNSVGNVGLSNSCSNPPTQPNCFLPDGSLNPANNRESQPITWVSPSAPTFKLDSFYVSGSLGDFPPFGTGLTANPLVLKLYDVSGTLLNGALGQSFSAVAGGGTVNVTYTGSNVKYFTISGQQSFYVIDGVAVTPVPEPSSYVLMVLGVVAVGGFAARRRFQQ